MTGRLILDGSSLTTEKVVSIARDFTEIEIGVEGKENVRKGRESIERMLKTGGVYYGINTGFGKLADTVIPNADLEKLQVNLIRSHSVGVGQPFAEDEVRAIMVVRLNSLLKGYSGVSLDVIEQLQIFLNEKIYPLIPRFGSLGASGDLIPSAHLALCMIGESYVFDNGKQIPTRIMLQRIGIKPLSLKAKEGLSIINGTQVMTALGCLLIHDAEISLNNMDGISAMSLEALRAHLTPFQSRIQLIRPQEGQREVASRITKFLQDSTFVGSSRRVQDPYSLRCIPQVHGAFYDALRFARSIIANELNSVTDNPIVFSETDEIVSTGNFHGQPVSLALDLLCISLAEASMISERRIDKLLSGLNTELPLFLAAKPGLHSGLMVTQYSAAALVAQNRILAQPASLESANVSAGQEDHASMGVNAALKGLEVLENTLFVLAVEAVCSAQAIDVILDKNPKLKQGIFTSILHKKIRELCPRIEADQTLFEEIKLVAKLLRKDLGMGEFQITI